jgi:DNA-binding MarR family transcriptional regulator
MRNDDARPEFAQAELLRRLGDTLEVLRRGLPEMPTSWVIILLRVAERPACTVAWLAETVGLSPSVVNRVLHELGSGSHRAGVAGGLLDSTDDPVNTKRKVYLLTERGRERIEQALSTAFGVEGTYAGATIETYRSTLAGTDEPPRVRIDHFSQSQVSRIKAAASRHFADFVGDNVVVFPLEPARPLIQAYENTRGEQDLGLAHWVEENRGRWYEMSTIYPAEGGVGLADFDDANDAFHFVLRWRGVH